MIFGKKRSQRLSPHAVAKRTGSGTELSPRTPGNLRRAPCPPAANREDAKLDESQSVPNSAHDELMLRHSIGLASDKFH